MRKVWKLLLAVTDRPQDVWMPDRAKIVHVAVQGPSDDISLWYECDPDAPRVKATFVVHGTGHSIDHDGTYVGTVLTAGGSLVWHVYRIAS
jgi:hypothetical protein